MAEHREIEQRLDELFTAVGGRTYWNLEFRSARVALEAHYDREDPWLAGISGKMLAQHDEARELAAAVEQAIAAGQSEDAQRLVRRFLAIAQHNMIEEERDVFPLLNR